MNKRWGWFHKREKYLEAPQIITPNQFQISYYCAMFKLSPCSRIILILTFLQLLTFNSYAQSNTDLIHDFEQLENNNEKRLSSLIDVDWSNLYLSKDSLNALLKQGIVLSKTISKEYEMYKLILIHTEMIGNFSDDRMGQLDELIAFSKTNGLDSLQISGIYWKGRGLGMRNEFAKAIKILTELLNREDKLIEKDYKIHAMAYEELAILNKGYGASEETIAMYEKSLKINETNKDSAGICSNLHNIGSEYLFTPEFEEYKVYMDRSLVLAKQIKRKDLELLIYLNYSNKFGFNEMYDSCLVYALQAEQLSKENKNLSSEAQVSDIISACYLNLGQLPKALTYQLRAYELIEGAFSKNKMALNVGLVYIAMKDYEKATNYYDTALELANITQSSEEVANVSNHMGYLNLKQEYYEKALENFNMANDKSSQSQNVYLKNETYRGLAMAHQKLGNSALSNGYIEKALTSENNFKQLTDLYQIQAKNFEKLGNYELAYQAHKNYAQNKDSFNTKSNKELENTILAKYSVEKAENQVKISKMDKEVSDLNAEKQRRMKLFGFLLLGLSLVSIVIIISRHKNFLAEREKTRKLEEESAQAIIDQSRNILASQSDLILNKNRLIEELKNNLNTLFNEISVDTTGLNSFLDSKILTKEDWDKFKISFTVVYPTFIQTASEIYPGLTTSELRLMCLQKIGMTSQESADMLGVLHDSVKRTTHRIYQKFNIDSSLSLQEVVEKIG